MATHNATPVISDDIGDFVYDPTAATCNAVLHATNDAASRVASSEPTPR